MYRPNLVQKRLYDDINPAFGLNKRGRNSSSFIRQRARPPVYDSEPGTSRRPTHSFRPPEEGLLPFGPNSSHVSGPSGDSPYFNSKCQPILTEKSYNTAPPTAPVQKKTTPQLLPGPLKPKSRNGIHILTGTVDKVLLWSKMTRNHRVLFEVYGIFDYVRQGGHPCEKVFVMRDSNSSPTLQVVFYEIDRPLIPLEPGSMIKVQGNMTSRSRLQAFNVQKTNEEELNASQRVFYICDRAVQDLIN